MKHKKFGGGGSARKPMPGTASNAPDLYGPESRKDISMRESNVAGGGRMTSATRKRNTTMTQDARTRAAGETRARNIEGHQSMTKKATDAIAAATASARKPAAKPLSESYLIERLRKAAEGPENRSAESLQRGAIGRANREQARETQDRKAKRPMAKGGKVMKHATKAGKAMTKKSADTMGRAMVKKYAKGGSIDGCATKGKTKAKMVKMAMGGMTGYKRGGKTC